MNESTLYETACAAAKTAVSDIVRQHGEPMYCGFGNVIVKPARGKLVKYLKAIGVGGTQSWGGGGYRISYYDIMSGHPYCHTQSMDLKEIGCQAFADVLTDAGYRARLESRAD